MCLILNGYGATAIWIYKHKETVNGNKEGKLLLIIFVLISSLNDVCVTLHNECSQNPTIILTL